MSAVSYSPPRWSRRRLEGAQQGGGDPVLAGVAQQLHGGVGAGGQPVLHVAQVPAADRGGQAQVGEQAFGAFGEVGVGAFVAGAPTVWEKCATRWWASATSRMAASGFHHQVCATPAMCCGSKMNTRPDLGAQPGR